MTARIVAVVSMLSLVIGHWCSLALFLLVQRRGIPAY